MDEDLDDLLRFCIAASVITGFTRRKNDVLLETGAGNWALPALETRLFLHGALKYRPDLLAEWSRHCQSRSSAGAPRRGLAA